MDSGNERMKKHAGSGAVFWIHHGHCSHEHEAMTAFTRPEKQIEGLKERRRLVEVEEIERIEYTVCVLWMI